MKTTLAIFLASGTAAVAASAIIRPTVSSVTNENAFSGQSFTFVVNNSGLTPAVNTGDSLASASAAVHTYGGFTESFVTNDSTTDYFATGTGATAPPIVVFDLGSDTTLANILLWQYQNDGGSPSSVGNHTRTLNLRFNTAAQGAGSFSGGATTITMLPVADADGIGGNDLGGTNSAQVFGISGTARYVQLTITDNYRGFQGIGLGGDRAGLGEVRFFGEAIPEASSAALLLLSGSFLARRRRR